MSQGIYTIASSMDAAMRRLEVVSDNLANVDSTAFKRRGTSFHSMLASRGGSQQTVVAKRETMDHSQGSLLETALPFDLALFGEGFFAVDTADGEAFTRDGRFHVTADGVLVDGHGQPVAWEGAGGAIDPTGEQVVIDGEGAVRQGDLDVGRLRITNFADNRRLELDSEGYYRAPRGLEEVNHEARVHQGHLEQSNVSPLEELVHLIEVARAFERSSNAMAMIDRSYQRLNRAQ